MKQEVRCLCFVSLGDSPSLGTFKLMLKPLWGVEFIQQPFSWAFHCRRPPPLCSVLLSYCKFPRTHSGHDDPEIRLTRLPLHPLSSLCACVCCVSTATRQQAGLLGGGEEADHAGRERSPREAAADEPVGGLRGRGDERGGGGHVGVSSGPDETSGDPGGRAGHAGEAPHLNMWPLLIGWVTL